MNSSLYLFIAVSLCYTKLTAQEHSKQVDTAALPVPNEKGQLFYLQRDPNTNTVVYTLNKKNGKIDESNPVNAYWILYEEDGERKNLSFIQKKLAYGIQHKKLANDEFEINLTSCKKVPLRLAYCPESAQYEAFASINNKQTIIDRIFVRINGGSLFKPNIDYIELIGRESKSGKGVKHILEMD
ncbi:DUF4833 domain-containing protein [Olivibacter sp. SDN3]|uniref:DUF4833 domain-containing protein n=1 Tax=Olivibacter sp. SDN3 TaxID=2764720 RepID=UPI0016511A35|nr:DUF4833 domain-containing protein [Olivibacter sp. SDN3]QNL50403.1 DUF4833 domain-containing protein [Olivibacter sp. SDN3]